MPYCSSSAPNQPLHQQQSLPWQRYLPISGEHSACLPHAQFGAAMGLPGASRTREVASQIQQSLERKQLGEVTPPAAVGLEEHGWL